MADKSRIRVAVVEGNYANLCGLSLPLSLCLQLQTQAIRSGALWSAKASASVSLKWPTTGTAPEDKAKKARRKRRKCNNKATTSVIVKLLPLNLILSL